jgi:hypothetical protein
VSDLIIQRITILSRNPLTNIVQVRLDPLTETCLLLVGYLEDFVTINVVIVGRTFERDTGDL